MHITSVERNKKNKNKFSIYVDGEYSFTISEEDYLSLNLYEERDLTEDEFNNIKYDIYYRSAKSLAIRYLSLKIRTEKEVEKRLNDDGYGLETISQVVNELKSIGYINDKIYAQKFVFDRSKLKPKSKKMLKFELLNKGVAEVLVDEVLDNWEIDEDLVVEGLLKRKFGKYDLSDEKVLKKAYSFLLHRGFSFSTIEKVIKNFI